MKEGKNMLSDLIKDLNGDSWEKLCQKCYKLKYANANYREIPANPGGDAGIEGFTSTGIVNQCYYPEGNYTDKEYYENLRDKMTADIKKLLDPDYKTRLIAFGVPIIKQWHFLIPEYRDNKILIHAKNKTDEVKQKIESNPEQYDYISDQFEIVVQEAENLQAEIYQVSVADAWKNKLDITTGVKEANWIDCPSEKIENIKRKIAAIKQVNEDDEIEDMVRIYAEAYIRGIDLMTKLSESYKDLFCDLQLMLKKYKKKVEKMTALNPNSNENYSLFMSILEEFEFELDERFPSLNDNSTAELVEDLIGTWLADCSLKFK